MAVDTQFPEIPIQDPFLNSILGAAATLREQTSALLELVNKHYKSSSSGKESAIIPPDLHNRQADLSTGITELRNQNRHVAHLVRDTKATTSVSRAEVDRLHLGLQNLYYEERHLVGEIAGCEEYVHPYTQLPLIPDDKFFAKYPEWLTRKDEEGEENGERGLMRARIDEEKREREELEARRIELVKRKEELVKENSKKKEALNDLDKQLETFFEVSLRLVVCYITS